jgi:hypothetical protein
MYTQHKNSSEVSAVIGCRQYKAHFVELSQKLQDLQEINIGHGMSLILLYSFFKTIFDLINMQGVKPEICIEIYCHVY